MKRLHPEARRHLLQLAEEGARRERAKARDARFFAEALQWVNASIEPVYPRRAIQ